MLGRVEKRPRGRVKPKQQTGVRIASASVNTTVLTLSFDQPVVLRGTPQYTTDVVGATVASATSPSPAAVELTFSADIAMATQVTIPYLDPGVRSRDGGYVVDSTFPVA